MLINVVRTITFHRAFVLSSKPPICRRLRVSSSSNGDLGCKKAHSNSLIHQLSNLFNFKPSGSNGNAELINHLMEFFKQKGNLPKEFLQELLKVSAKHQTTLPNVLKIKRPRKDNAATGEYTGNLTIVGDVHGQYEDFAQIFQKEELGGFPSELNQFIFNGDLVDRGPMAVEIVTVLLVSKLLDENSVHILRGNHETQLMNKVYGFQEEVLSKYDWDLLDSFRAFFDTLPVAAVVEDSVFVTHGGIGPTVATMTVNDIDQLDRFGEPPIQGAISELLWSGE